MIEEGAFKSIVELALAGVEAPLVQVEDGTTRSKVPLYETRQPEKEPVPLAVARLDSLVRYLAKNLDALDPKEVVVLVENERRVFVASRIRGTCNQRFGYASASSMYDEIRGFGNFLDQETFVIWLQSCFADTPDRRKLLDLVGSIQSRDDQTVTDDGVAQTVNVKVSTAPSGEIVNTADVPNPIFLVPFRSFPEVDGVSAPFVVRVRKGSSGPEVALFEADCGAWKVQACDQVRDYLQAQLEEESSASWTVL